MIDKHIVEEFLVELGRPYKDAPHKGEFYVCSPFSHGDRDYKCIVSYSKGGIFNCFKSGTHGNFFKFISLTQKITYREAKTRILLKAGLTLSPKEEESAVTEEEKFILPSRMEKLDPIKHEEYARYLVDRKVGLQMADRLGVHVDTDRFHQRVVFPVSENEQLIGYAGRTIRNFILPRWYNKGVTRAHMVLWMDNEESAYLFEGIFDAATVPGGVCTFGSSIGEEKLNKILARGSSKIVCVFDNDEPGLKAQIKCADWLAERTSGVFVFDWTKIDEHYKDFSEIDDPAFFTSRVYDEFLLEWPRRKIEYEFNHKTRSIHSHKI